MNDKNKLMSNQLNDLLDVACNSCGPLLIKELKERIDQTVGRFNSDINNLLTDSFEKYKDRVKFCKKIINDKALIEDAQSDIIVDSESIAPTFIKDHQEKKE